ncbi:hypothetical protein D3C78_1077830 [compost metagenome]
MIDFNTGDNIAASLRLNTNLLQSPERLLLGERILLAEKLAENTFLHKLRIFTKRQLLLLGLLMLLSQLHKREKQLIPRERLQNIILDTELQRFARIFELVMPCNKHNAYRRVLLLQPLRQLQPIHERHRNIDKR